MPKRFRSLQCVSIIVAMFVASIVHAMPQDRFEIVVNFGPSGPPCLPCSLQLEAAESMLGISTSSVDGQFQFAGVKPGDYVVRGVVDGFERIEQPIRLDPLRSASRVFVTIELKPTVRAGRAEVVDISAFLGNQPEKAVDFYKRALNNYGKKKIQAAIQQFEEALRLAPALYAAHNDLGNAYVSAGRFDEGEREFLTAKQINSSNPEPLIRLAALYVRENKLDLAAKSSMEALARDPRSVDATFYLGLALYCDSRFEIARDALHKALSLDPESLQVHYLLAATYVQFHQQDTAKQLLETYAKRQPRSRRRTMIGQASDQWLRDEASRQVYATPLQIPRDTPTLFSVTQCAD